MKAIPLQYSDYEIQFFLILKEIGVRFLTQEFIAIKKNDKIKNYLVDFIIKKVFYYDEMECEGIVFEVQGEQHEERGRMKKDEMKKEDLERNGYHVYEISYKELKDKKKLKEKIIEILKNEGIKNGI